MMNMTHYIPLSYNQDDEVKKTIESLYNQRRERWIQLVENID